MRPARLVLAALAGVLALAAPHQAAAAPSVTLRPTTMGSTFAYTTAEATPFVGPHAVVHYEPVGAAAPPLTDANGNGYPDYVEQVAAAAETALTYYGNAGFKRPLADRAGPDAKPDIYIGALPTGVYGVTFMQQHAEGGTFVIVSPKLDLSLTKPTASVGMTVAHELFHVIQFAYVTSDNVPVWASEGSATAMSMRVFPQVEDQAIGAYLDAWLKTPWLPLYDERKGCLRCYGGAWWWLYLERLSPRILPAYFAKLGADDRKGVSTRIGLDELDAALRTTRAGSLFDVFSRFSLDLYRRGLPVADAYALKTSTTPRTTTVRTVFGLSTHYVPIRVARGSRGLVVSVPYGGGPRPAVTLVLGGPKGRKVTAKPYRSGQGFLVSALFRNARERKRIVLVVTSGSANGVHYVVDSVAVGRHGRLPGWVAF